jgi:AcrR family transcriptional regulator
MGYEVIKTIGTGTYRYEVESYRDPQTGKVRNKWRYLGKAEGNQPPRRRARAEETREKLTSALEQLLDRVEWSDVTAHDIAAQAGVAPATLYRYFKSRDDVLLACVARANRALDERLAELQNIGPDPQEERARLRAWTISLIADSSESAVFLALVSSSLNRQELARERYEHRLSAFRSYLELLADRGYISEQRDLADTATALSLCVQAFSYRALLGRIALREYEYNALANAIARLVFD